MLYSPIQYPASFGVLTPEVRRLAIEIANRLLEEGLSRTIAEQIAIANSRERAKIASAGTNAHIADCTIHVIPHKDGWAIISQDVKRVYAVYESKKEAVTKARTYAKCVKFKLFIHCENGFIKDSENFIVNRPVTLSADRLPYSRVHFN